jgi:transposase-like protein
MELGSDMGYPDYGLPDDFRLRVIRRANEAGPILAAAEYNVGLSTVYMWIKEYQGVIA